MSELKSVYIDRTGNWVRSGNDTSEFYLKSEADKMIKELRAQKAQIEDDCAYWKNEYAELKDKLHNVSGLLKETLQMAYRLAEVAQEMRRQCSRLLSQMAQALAGTCREVQGGKMMDPQDKLLADRLHDIINYAYCRNYCPMCGHNLKEADDGND